MRPAHFVSMHLLLINNHCVVTWIWI